MPNIRKPPIPALKPPSPPTSHGLKRSASGNKREDVTHPPPGNINSGDPHELQNESAASGCSKRSRLAGRKRAMVGTNTPSHTLWTDVRDSLNVKATTYWPYPET